MTTAHPPTPAPGAPLVAERLSDRLAARLARQIESGKLQPGDQLPTEPRLAAAHGVSRTVVREAVTQLKSQGLLVARQGLGVFVTAAQPNRPFRFDPRTVESIDSVMQIVEVRRALEAETAALAALRATPAQIEGLRDAVRAIDDATAGDGVDEDMALHRGIADASGNPQFSRLLDFLAQYLREAMRVTRANAACHGSSMDETRAEHHALVEAIAARDAERARRLATEHVARAARRLEAGGAIAAPQPLPASAP